MTDFDAPAALEKAIERLDDTLVLAAYCRGESPPIDVVRAAASRNEVEDLLAMKRHVVDLVEEVQQVSPADPYVKMQLAFDLAQLDDLSIAEGVVAVEILVPSFELVGEFLRDAS